MNPPVIAVKTANQTLDFVLPEGESIAEMRVNGEEVHGIHEVAMTAKRQSKYWAILACFTSLATIVTTALVVYGLSILKSIPEETARTQQLIRNNLPPAFHVGYTVVTDDGVEGVIHEHKRNQYGRWIYKIEGSERWREEPYLTFKGLVSG